MCIALSMESSSGDGVIAASGATYNFVLHFATFIRFYLRRSTQVNGSVISLLGTKSFFEEQDQDFFSALYITTL